MVRSSAAAASPVDRFFQFAVLGLVASGYLAVAGSGYLDAPTAIAMAAALFLRALYSAGVLHYEIPVRANNLATLVYMVVYGIDYEWISGSLIPATVHLIFFLAVVKVLTASTNRDYFLLKLIAFMELIAASILSSRLNFFVFLALFLVLGVATFTSSEIRQASRRRKVVIRGTLGRGLGGRGLGIRGLGVRLAASSVLVSCGILLFTAALFFVLPRTARAAFQHLSTRYHVPGFADSVTLGEIGEIQKSDAPVMHVRMDEPRDRGLMLKWRGASLSKFDGARWFNPPDPAGFEERVAPDRPGEYRLIDNRRRSRFAKHISYSVHLKDIASNVLFFAGRPEFLRIDAPFLVRSAAGSYRFFYRQPGTVVYEGYSTVVTADGTNDADPDSFLSFDNRAPYLQLPRIDPRIAAMARSIAPPQTSELRQARAIEAYLRSHYGYTLDLPAKEPRDPLADFLFVRRKGHCEYFASAMAVMLRTIGIPSRVATGFGPGVYNPVSGWQIIRASDAHSWVEAYVPPFGWTSFDPTPPDPNPGVASVWARIGFYLDAADTFWQDWVLNYNTDRQFQLASKVGESGERMRLNWVETAAFKLSDWAPTLAKYGAFAIFLLVAAVIIRRFGRDLKTWLEARRRVIDVSRGKARPTDATLLYARMLKLLKNRGIEKPAWLTPVEFAGVIPEAALSSQIQDFTDAYNDLRFGCDVNAAARMLRALDQLGMRS